MKRRRITTRSIVESAQRTLGAHCNDAKENGEYQSESDEMLSCGTSDEDPDEFDLSYDESGVETEELREISTRENMWRKLTTQDLCRVSFLLSETNSKRAVNDYFVAENVRNRETIKQLITDGSQFSRVVACNRCSKDVERCQCILKEKCEIVFCAIRDRLQFFVELSSSPMNCGDLRERLLKENDPGTMTIHVQCAFDGIRLHKRGKMKIWPLTLSCLDLEDVDSHEDPTSKTHDRIVRWILHSFCDEYEWNGLKLRFELVTGVHDDQAKRLLYNLKGHSARGSCPYCLNQQTLCKINNGSTKLREKYDRRMPDALDDGLKIRGQHSFFHEVVPMFTTPLDMFHLFSEGIHNRLLNEMSATKRLPLFANCHVDLGTNVRIPSRYGTISGRLSNITGTEKSCIFQSIVVANAFLEQLPPIPSAICLLIHALFRLNICPTSVDDRNLYGKCYRICNALHSLVTSFCPELLRGSKVHQIIYHLPDNVRKFGSLLPLSTQIHEHYYHVLQRHLVSEITNGLPTSLMRNAHTVQELKAEVHRRHLEYADLGELWHGAALLNKFQLTQKRCGRTTEVPERFKTFAFADERFSTIEYVRGVKFSTLRRAQCDDSKVIYSENGHHRYGQIMGFLVHNDTSRRVIIQKYGLTNKHVLRLSGRLLSAGVPRDVSQSVLDSLYDSAFGMRVVQDMLNAFKQRNEAPNTQREINGRAGSSSRQSAIHQSTPRRSQQKTATTKKPEQYSRSHHDHKEYSHGSKMSPLKPVALVNGEQLEEELGEDELVVDDQGEFGAVGNYNSDYDDDDYELFEEAVPVPSSKSNSRGAICPLSLGIEIGDLSEEILADIRRKLVNAVRCRVTFDYSAINEMINHGSDDVKATCLMMKGLMHVIEALYEDRTNSHGKNSSKDVPQATVTFNPQCVRKAEPSVVTTTNGHDVCVNTVFQRTSPMSGTLRTVVHHVANAWLRAILKPEEMGNYTTSTKPMSSSRTIIPAELLNEPVRMLLECLSVEGGVVDDISSHVGLLFKEHITNKINHQRSVDNRKRKGNATADDAPPQKK
ncbi:unnamed protein product [Caenorhabditis sp. 36 PRJEB53466]|nr:unnamed protein product [Caenorhabditis sp. 36 PRJEB53466]